MKKDGAKTQVKDNPSLTIPVTDNSLDAAFRLFDDNEKKQQEYYASTRNGGIKRVPGGYCVEIPEELFAFGKTYELKVLGKKITVIDGKLVEAKKTEINSNK